MQTPRFMQHDEVSLQSLYEHNYWLFRLVLPQPPADDDWYLLRAPQRAAVYLRCIGRHAYTSEWLLGHFYPARQQRRIAPDYRIRVYHDARLAEARFEPNLPLRELRTAKFAHNRALAEWLDYCRRHQYRLHGTALTCLPDIA